MLEVARHPFATQTSLIRARLLSGTALESDETGVRVGKRNWWLWVFHHKDSAVFVADPSRGANRATKVIVRPSLLA
jgi:transposase